VPGLINRVPQGFLALLDLKAQGENARELSPQLVSVIDALDFYLAPVRVNVTNQNAPVLGPQSGGATLTANPAEIWMVRSVSAFSNAAIAAAATLELQVGYIPLSGVWQGLGPVSGVKGVGDRAVSAYSDPFILQPGEALGYFSSVLTGVPGNVRVSAMIARLSF